MGAVLIEYLHMLLMTVGAEIDEIMLVLMVVVLLLWKICSPISSPQSLALKSLIYPRCTGRRSEFLSCLKCTGISL